MRIKRALTHTVSVHDRKQAGLADVCLRAVNPTFTKGAKLFCDFHFGGKPKAVCLEVITPGNGKDTEGKVRVKLTETVRGYDKGEELELSTFYAVPMKMVLPPKAGEYFTRVSTLYSWI